MTTTSNSPMAIQTPVTAETTDLLLRVIAALRRGQKIHFYPSFTDRGRDGSVKQYNRMEIDIQTCPVEQAPRLMSRSHLWKGPAGMVKPPADAKTTRWERSGINEWTLNDFLEEITYSRNDYPHAFTGLPPVTDETKAADPIIASLCAVVAGETVNIPYLGDTTFNLTDGFVYRDSHNEQRFFHDTDSLLAHNVIVKDKAS